MNVVIPPLIFYVLGSALLIAGGVRLFTLGRRNPAREVADDDPAKARSRRRHFTFGLVWMGMGLFLIISTALALRTRAETSSPMRGPAPSSVSPSPVIRLDPARPTTLQAPAAP